MMLSAYQEGDEKKYFPAVLAALMVVAVAVGAFIYSLVKADPEDVDDLIIIEEEDGSMGIDPARMNFPTGPPSVPHPSTPPPSSP